MTLGGDFLVARVVAARAGLIGLPALFGAGGRLCSVVNVVVTKRVGRLGLAGHFGLADGAVDDLVVAAARNTSRSNLVLTNRRTGLVSVRLADRDRHSFADRIAVVALDVVLRRLGAGRVAGLLLGGRRGEAMTVRFAHRNGQLRADRTAVVALDIVGRRLGAGGLSGDLIGRRVREAVLRYGLPRQDRAEIAAAGVGLVGLAQICRHISRCKCFQAHRCNAVEQTATDALQLIGFEEEAIAKARSAAQGRNRADAGVLISIGNRANIVAVGNCGSGILTNVAGNTGDMVKGRIGFRLYIIFTDQHADVIAICDRGRTTTISGDTGNGHAAGQRTGVVAAGDRRAADRTGNTAAATLLVKVCDSNVGSAILNGTAILSCDNASGNGLKAHCVGAAIELHIAGNKQVADRALAITEQSLIGCALAVKIFNGMARAVKRTAEVAAGRIANGLPKLAAEVDVLSQYGIAAVSVAAGVDLIGKPCQLRAGFDAIPAGHVFVSAGCFLCSNHVRLFLRLAVPAGLHRQRNVNGKCCAFNLKAASDCNRACGFNLIGVRTGHQAIGAVLLGRLCLSGDIRNSNLRFTDAFWLYNIESNRIGRNLGQRDGKFRVLTQHNLAGRRLIALGADGIGVCTGSELIRAVALRILRAVA